MNWTENGDQIEIKKIADNVAKKTLSSRYLGKVYQAILPYDFNTPLELQEKLKEMWKELNKPEMDDLALPVTIAAFKNREAVTDIEVSPFNYEF